MSRLALATASVALAVLLSVPAAASADTLTFAQPGATSWQVPRRVHFATFELYGAAGGFPGAAQGAYVKATLRVRPRAVLTIVVGGRGGDALVTGGPGGFGGGGRGGDGSAPVTIGNGTFGGSGGAGGGGASDVRTGPADATGLASRVLVAGGGGGGAEWPGGAGGAIGHDAASGRLEDAFCMFSPPCPSQPGGAGGTSTAGGNGPGGAGFLGVGGGGGSGGGVQVVLEPFPFVQADSGGGGGGGGYFGGGGGAAGHIKDGAAISLHEDFDTTGGGGGSSFVTPQAHCPPVIQDGVRGGNGQVVVTFTRGGARRHPCT